MLFSGFGKTSDRKQTSFVADFSSPPFSILLIFTHSIYAVFIYNQIISESEAGRIESKVKVASPFLQALDIL
ncbi:MAG: hypothetical protein IPN09_09135 [Bacteroidetes bacterium]|nr:hypothetical protein [Bacteroidota bacterium]